MVSAVEREGGEEDRLWDEVCCGGGEVGGHCDGVPRLGTWGDCL